MSERWILSVLDVSGIQDYIFGSNRLRDNIGASHLVEQATGAWIRAALPPGAHNLDDDARPRDAAMEQDNTLLAEVIYRGGGNVVILFRTHEDALQSIERFSRTLLEEAPGLELAAAHVRFDPAVEAVGGSDGVYARLFEADSAESLRVNKQRRPASAPLLGLAVTRECASTGLPAVDFFDYAGNGSDIQPISAAVRAKVDNDVIDAADERLRRILPSSASNYRIPRQLDELGRSRSESSYIAVVHADGNGLGRRFRNLAASFEGKAANRACLNELRHLSRAVEDAGRVALERTVDAMLQAFVDQSQDFDHPLTLLLHELRSRRHGQRPPLPFRPLVFGGDDTTFTCDGRLGLGLAARYLAEFEAATRTTLPEEPIYACAGIAVVKSHYPFARAYRLSVELCNHAKQAVREAKSQGDCSALDWHFAASGVGGRLAVLRQRGYTVAAGDLTMRPITLFDDAAFGWRTWPALRAAITGLTSGEWRERRNKVIGLHEKLREGDIATRAYRKAFDLPKLPKLATTFASMQEGGWHEDRCGYFDAIEALDFFIDLG